MHDKKLPIKLNVSIKKFFIIYFFTLISVNAQYQDLHFDHITTDDGLSRSSVTCIMQDNRGYMWIGTFNGLNRYDGYNFYVYQYNQSDPQSISHNYISSMIEDHEGRLWVGTSDGLNCYNRVTDNFKRYRHTNNNSKSISDNQIEVIFEDSKKRLWIGTRNGGLNLFERKSKSFVHYVHDKNNNKSLSSNFIREIFEDSNGNLWIGHWNGAIDIFDDKRNEFYHLSNQGKKLTNSAITSIVESEDKNLWIGTQGDGLYRIKYSKGEVQVINHYLYNPNQKNGITGNIILSLMIDHNQKLWIGTEDKGLNILDIKKGTFYNYKTNLFDRSSLNNNSIYSIYEDKNGNIWIGTYAGGINLIVNGKAYFQYYKHIPGIKNTLSNNIINCFLEDKDKNIWIGTGGGGLNYWDRKNNKFVQYVLKNRSINGDIIMCLYEDSNHNLWIGTWADGLYKFDRKTKSFLQFTKEKNGLASNNIFQIIEGKKGELWLCTFWGGLTYFNIETQSAKIYNTENSGLMDNDVRTIAKDSYGNLWIGTDVGVNVFNPAKGTFKSYRHNNYNKNSLSKGFVSCIIQTVDSSIWIGTTGGLDKFDRKTNSFSHFTTSNGLPSNEIMTIVEDNNGMLWISTTKGISRFNPKSGVFKNYDVTDGLQGNEFNARSGLKTSKGEILFGGNNGFNIFQPEKLRDNLSIPPVYISDFKIFNKSVPIGGKDSPLQKNITETKELVLSYKHSVFSFGFVALNYNSPEKNQYAYMMEGFDKFWNYVGTNRTATYTNLDPGVYTFRVKASNNDGIWNETGASIKIIIEPPFWKTWWAYIIESLLIITIIYFILNYYISRQRLRNALKMEHLELEKMYEIDQMKSQFFSNISHELHSPLTLILSPLEKLITSEQIEEKIQNSLKIIYRNALRLKRMTNQLKDLNKIETGDLKLCLSKGDIIYFIKECSNSFQDYAIDHYIDFEFVSSHDEYIAWFDPDKLDKIIYNLLSNAFKFTPDNGKIIIYVNIISSKIMADSNGDNDKASQYIEISVQDNGIGIPEDKIEHIFKRYYHLEEHNGHRYEGSGIGLAFVYELVNLYKGKIFVDSKVGEGTKFTVQIPIDEHYLEENQLVAKFNVNTSLLFSDTSSMRANELKNKYKLHNIPVILIIEDDKEIRDYIKNSFDVNYRVHEAEDGQIGYKKAIQIIPDLIITDIKMREIDGITLCKKLKNDERTSHIPIIILTSYSSQEYQIKGLTYGADVYLPKPFSINVLEAYIINLLDSRKKLQEKFSREFIYGPSKISITDIDAKFLKNLVETIEEHISDEKFNADVLSQKIGMSRMQLYRKLRGLTDQTVHEFIRNIRLKHAVQLLEQKKMTITEVAYAVGFNDLTYFARCFKKQYGKSPSEYISNKA